ncbi:hypothetical protein AGMMS49965_01310 [Bacteroidia bacterium]|nr:hypothetical protein AGMMS49965_01310 [Bacteroidia bacterium]
MKKVLYLLFAFILFPVCLFSQVRGTETAALKLGVADPVKLSKEYPAKGEIKMFDNSSFRLVYYVNTNEINTHKDVHVANAKDVSKLAMNPTGNSFSLIQKKLVMVYSFQEINKKLFELKYKSTDKKAKRDLTTIAYSGDASKLLVGFSNGEIFVCNTKDYQPDFVLQSGTVPVSALTMSPNGYFIASVKGEQIDIWNFEKREIRSKLHLDAEPAGVAFSNDASQLAVSLPNQLVIYNTRTWEIAHSYPFEGTVTSPSFNADDKYVSFVHNNNEIVVLNILKKEVIQKISEPGTIGACGFLKSSSQPYLVANRLHAIVYWNSKDLEPYYGKIVGAEVEKKMSEWVKKKTDESAEDYKNRVNDDTRAPQVELLRQEATTALAGNLIAHENPFAGIYNAESGLLSINFTTLPSIEISVPNADVEAFRNKKDLAFHDVVYLLNESDEFVLAYLELTNKANGKEYVYDNIGRTPPPVEEPDFVPLDILQIASQEEENLKAITADVIKKSKAAGLITDNTDIQVGTSVLTDVDAEGNKILNYQLNYNYIVFANGEDYPPGGYDVTKSNAAMSLMSIVKQTLEGDDFTKYFETGTRVKIAIVGSADASPIRGKIAYDGRYGDFEREPYYQNGELNSMTLTKATGITSNPQLAYIRTASVQDWMSKNITTLRKTRNDYQSHIEVAEEEGGEFRRVEVQFTIIDAFK